MIEAIRVLIEKMAFSQKPRSLMKAREELTQRYLHPSCEPYISCDAERYAYLTTRFPATYAAIQQVLHAAEPHIHKLSLKSLLDVGAGPGTAALAICEQFPGVETVSLIEQDSAFVDLGQTLLQASEHPSLQSALWQVNDFTKMTTFLPHDLVIFSYSIGEIEEKERKRLIDQAWKSAKELLIVIEPGTPAGFERVRAIRQQLIESGAHLLAPCPHLLTCPMEGKDWCHFATRVERSSLHRRLKQGTLGHEDEKFSYLIATKQPFPPSPSRLLRHPAHHSGHLSLHLCTSTGLRQVTLSKKMGEAYKRAKKLKWGDVL